MRFESDDEPTTARIELQRPRVARARLRRHARRGRAACVDELLAAPTDLDARAARCSRLYADVRALNRPHADGSATSDELGSPQEHLHAFLRSLDADAEGLPDRFVAHLERALAHYGVEGLERTGALEDAAYRLFLSQQRATDRARGRARGAHPPPRARRQRAATSELPRRARPPRGRARAARAARSPSSRARCAGAAATSPRVERGRARQTYAAMEEHLRRARRRPGGDERDAAHGRARRVPAAARRRCCAALAGDAGPLVEAMTRRYYRIRTLERRRAAAGRRRPVRAARSYVRDGVPPPRRRDDRPQPDDLPAALRALAAHARALPEGEPLLADLYALRSPTRRRTLSAGRDRPRWRASRAATAVSRVDVRARRPRSTCGRSRADGEQHRRARHCTRCSPSGWSMWRLREFALERLPVGPGHLPVPRRRRTRTRATSASSRSPRYATSTPVRDEHGSSPRCPSSSGSCAQAFEAMRSFQSQPPAARAAAAGTGCCSTPGRRSTSRPPRRARVISALRAHERRARARDGPAATCGSATTEPRARGAHVQPGRPRRHRRARRPADRPAAAARRGRAADRLRAPPRGTLHPGRDRQAAGPQRPDRRLPASSSSTTSTRTAGSSRSTGPPATNTAEHRGRADPQPHRSATPRGCCASSLLGDPTRGLGSLAERGVPARDRRARPRRAAQRAGRVVRPCPRARGSRWTPGLRTWTGWPAALRRIVDVHPGRRRDQRRRGGHQRRRPAVLERRGDDAHAHQGHPRVLRRRRARWC